MNACGFGGSPPPDDGDEKKFPPTPRSKSKSNKEFYVVLVGKKTGIFKSWFETAPLVLGYSGAIYKGYDTEAEAREVWARATSTSSDSIFSSDAGTPAPESPPSQQFNPALTPSQLTGISFIMPTQTLLSTAMALQDLNRPTPDPPSTPNRHGGAPATPARRDAGGSPVAQRAPSSAPSSGQSRRSTPTAPPQRRAPATGPDPRPPAREESAATLAARHRRLEAIRTAMVDIPGPRSDTASRRSGPRSDAGDVFSVGRNSPAPSAVSTVPPPSPAGVPSAQTSGTASVRYGEDAYTVRFHMDWQNDRLGRADSSRAPSVFGGQATPHSSPASVRDSPASARGSPAPARGSSVTVRGSSSNSRPLPVTPAQVNRRRHDEEDGLYCNCTPTSRNCPAHAQAAAPQVTSPASSSTAMTDLSTPSAMTFSSPSSVDNSDVISVGSSDEGAEHPAGPGEAYFAVIRGWDDGVFPGPYANIRAYVAGYPNAYFEGFDTLEEASEWYIDHFAEED
ncbi:hypothetical protein BV25DRAFT_1835384 [Artomyces pyxidatus]|uniref:Uncharacterized protein n=1 Tax=Artomyces pyxidatus TaxID=48021 RepID=A0ACB8TF71_9AGAM|nr:hypothetical protein BV25DRAFT_1835384 [Artomyces pyxidatus]